MITKIFKGLEQALIIVRGGTVALESALTGGLAVIVAFLPEIINWVSAIFKGKDAVSQMTNNLKNMNEMMKSANSSASEEISKLDVLYRAATQANIPIAEKAKNIQKLRDQYPGLLKGMSDEEVAHGKAKKNYDELTKSILANAKAKAALAKIATEEAKLLDADYQIEKIKNANLNEIIDKKKEIAAGPRFYKGNNPTEELANYKKLSDDRAKESIAKQDKANLLPAFKFDWQHELDTYIFFLNSDCFKLIDLDY